MEKIIFQGRDTDLPVYFLTKNNKNAYLSIYFANKTGIPSSEDEEMDDCILGNRWKPERFVELFNKLNLKYFATLLKNEPEAKDFFGNDLEVGDEVAFIRPNNRDLIIGTIRKLSDKKATIEFLKYSNKLMKTYRFYNQIIKKC